MKASEARELALKKANEQISEIMLIIKRRAEAGCLTAYIFRYLKDGTIKELEKGGYRVRDMSVYTNFFVISW